MLILFKTAIRSQNYTVCAKTGDNPRVKHTIKFAVRGFQ